MRSINIVENLWDAFMLVYAIFVIWSLTSLILALVRVRFTLRDWLGSLGLAVGSCSAVLFAWFLIYLWFERQLIAHGSALWLYYYTGLFLASMGLILGLAGRGWIRHSSEVISLVMVFQWCGRMIVGRKIEAFLTIVMFIFLATGGIIVLIRKFWRVATGVPGLDSETED